MTTGKLKSEAEPDLRIRTHSANVHVLTARCDLETGKSLNIAPPGWQKTFDPLRDAFNHEHGWSRPDDPARARAQQPGHRAYIEAATLRTGLEHEADPRELIRDYLTQRVEHGAVRSRADVVAALKEAELEVPRQGKDYVTAHDPETGKRWRLKGGCTSITSNRRDLTSRLQRRLETERAEIEATAERELKVLGESLRGVAESAVPSKPIRRRRPDGYAGCSCARGCGRWWPA